MDKLSYKDGYRKGIHQSLVLLLGNGVISRKQFCDFKDKFFNEQITVPEKPQFCNRDYINELKQFKNERKNYMQNIIPLIKEVESTCIYVDYNFKNINDMLVNGVGIKKSSASEILLVSNYYYYSNGSIRPEWDGFEMKSLIYLARCHKKGILDIYNFRKTNFIYPTMKFEEIKNVVNQLTDTEESTIKGLFGF